MQVAATVRGLFACSEPLAIHCDSYWAVGSGCGVPERRIQATWRRWQRAEDRRRSTPRAPANRQIDFSGLPGLWTCLVLLA